MKAFKTWKKQRDDLIKKPNYDPVKRRERYLREKEKKYINSLNQDNQAQSTSSTPVIVSSLYKGCNILHLVFCELNTTPLTCL